MTFIAAVLFALAAASELAGVGLIVGEIRAAKKILRTPIVRVIDGGRAGTDYNLPVEENSDPVELFLLNGRARQLLAVVFLVLGIVCGTVGNFLTLDW